VALSYGIGERGKHALEFFFLMGAEKKIIPEVGEILLY